MIDQKATPGFVDRAGDIDGADEIAGPAPVGSSQQSIGAIAASHQSQTVDAARRNPP